MSKLKVKYICSNCGFETLRWLGKCPQCSTWNSFIEEVFETGRAKEKILKKETKFYKLNEISSNREERIKTGILEFDRVLGGGFIEGSVVLIGGDPGIGKSTLVLQAVGKIKEKVLYVTGEESIEQIKMRANRLKLKSENILILPETDLNSILATIRTETPIVVVIDSIQTVYDSNYDNAAGTVTQIRECTSKLLSEAKKNNFVVVIIGHVTKEGMLAGPKLLEHIVDTVIQFEGEGKNSYRILRATKNRFGNTNEIGIFEMQESGLEEVKNPSELFLSGRDKNISGSAVTASIEGTRPLLIEVQALVTPSHFGNPQRVATGYDYRRLSILLAVLERRANCKVSSHNVFLNMVGGVRIDEPAADLAICSAIASSLYDKTCDNNSIIVGEVGLGGEIRSVGNVEKRISEAAKLGFKRIIIPASNNKAIKTSNSIQVISVDSLSETISLVLK
ncbi:MAG: DNA repair protein RadA [Chlorobiaceae bacterium]|nr:DNA repair protein RadA [Chlorobiaceae bacterium]MBA4309474.1 DNA repair protein RadA [Chlorobiaceae bacterium]